MDFGDLGSFFFGVGGKKLKKTLVKNPGVYPRIDSKGVIWEEKFFLSFYRSTGREVNDWASLIVLNLRYSVGVV